MAMIVGSSSGIWQAISEYNLMLYQYNMERGRTILQAAAATEMVREVAKIDAKYDGREEAKLEKEINAIFEKKSAISDAYTSTSSAAKTIEKLKIALAELSSLAIDGATEAFDAKIQDINRLVGSSTGMSSNLSNLIGNRSRGSWSSQIYLLQLGYTELQYKSQFLGTDYRIETDDGRVLEFNASNSSVGSYSFDNLVLVSGTIGNDEPVTFEDRSTIPPETITGTLKMGGLKIGSAWMYGLEDSSLIAKEMSALSREIGELADETVKQLFGSGSPTFTELTAAQQSQVLALLDPADVVTIQNKMVEIADKEVRYEQVKADNRAIGQDVAQMINQIAKGLEKTANEYQSAANLILRQMDSYDSSMKDLQRKYDAAAAETLAAKTAAREALSVKMELLDKKFALSSTTSATLISGLFSYQTLGESTSLYDILATDQYSAYKTLMGIS